MSDKLDRVILETGSGVSLRGGNYKADPSHTLILFHVEHLGLSTYSGWFDGVTASLDFDSETPEKATLDVRVPLKSLTTPSDALRDRLLGGWFDVAAHPQARFVSRQVSVTGETQGLVEGDLTLNGITRPVSLEVLFNGGAHNRLTGFYTIGFDATMEISRTAFGIDNLPGLVGDTVRVDIAAEFQRQ